MSLLQNLNLHVDDLTILLLLIAATLFLLTNLYRPQALVHPIVLGRQSDVGRARNPKESAVYRNYGTGLVGRFSVRPSKDVHVISDLVRTEVESSRTLWSTRMTNGALQDRVASFGTGLVHLARLQPQKSKVLLLLNDCLEFIIADLAFASHSIVSLTLTSPSLLSSIIKAHPPSAIICHAFLVPRLLEHLYDEGHRHVEYTIIVVGEPTKGTMASVASNLKIFRFEEVEREGTKREKVLSPIPKPSDVYTISFFESVPGEIQGVHLTHETITAGVAAIRGLFPASQAISALDTITSAHSMSNAFGRAIAYTAVFEGTSFASIPGSEVYVEEEKNRIITTDGLRTKKYPIPPATMMFVSPGQLTSLTGAVEEEATKSWAFGVGWRHKNASMRDGFVSNQTLWDRLVFDGARARAMGEDIGVLRAVVVSGGVLRANTISAARIVLSIPIVNTFTHVVSAAPILASHALDLQEFPAGPADADPPIAHCGAPTVNVEVKLIGVDDDFVESGGDPKGALLVRGPPVGKVVAVNGEDYVDVGVEEVEWAQTGVEARVKSNGSFVLVE